jgi:hypothetical protein
MLRLITVGLAIGLVLAGCGGSKGASPPATVTVTTAASTTTATTAPPPPPSTTEPASAPCESAAFLPVLKEAFDGAAPKLTVVKAKVQRCRNNYAQVFAVPDPSVCKPGVEYCYETEQVFLHWDGEAWTIETSGTGISCGSETDKEIVKICRALGYPDLDTPVFKMPSKNIGCGFYGGTLRCDILSGMVPEPTEGCPYDWVGLTITTGGPAEPQCAGDTVYDMNAPTLTYGGTWKKAGITCKSSEAGLACSNKAGHKFTLARGSWSAS